MANHGLRQRIAQALCRGVFPRQLTSWDEISEDAREVILKMADTVIDELELTEDRRTAPDEWPWPCTRYVTPWEELA